MILADEPPDPCVVVAVAHQHKPRVRVTLAAVRAPKPKRAACRPAAGGCPKPRKVLTRQLKLAAGRVPRPQVAKPVVGVVAARPAPALAEAGRIGGMAVR